MTELKSDMPVNSFDVQMPPATHASTDQKAFINHIDTSAPSPKLTFTTLIALVAVCLVIAEVLFTWILISTQKSKVATQERIIASAQQELSGPLSVVDKQVTQFSHGLSAYKMYKSSNRDYAPLWNDLKKYTIPNTRIKTLSVDDKGAVKLDGEAKSFVDIAQIIASLKRSTPIKNIDIISANSGETTKDFSLTATYSPSKARSVNGQE